MTTATIGSDSIASVSKGKRVTARVMGGLVIAFMLIDGIFKFIPNDQVIEGTTSLGFQTHHLPIMGTLSLLAIALFAIPRTQFIGAILLTGYWGGAIATHVRLDNPLFSHILFPIYLAILAWGSIWLKNENLRKVILSR